MKPLALLTPLAILLLTSLGCERAADTASPQHFNERGVSFAYPGNWSVVSDETADGARTITIETTSDSVAFVQRFEQDLQVPLETYAEIFSEAVAQELPVGEMSKGTYKPLQHKGKSPRSGVQEQVMMTFVGEKIPFVRAYFGFDAQLPQTVFICQIPTEDLEKVRPGCDLILDSLATQ